MGECSVWFSNIRTGIWRRSAPAEWTAYFGGDGVIPVSAYEHPNEISAYMLSLLSHDMKGSSAFRDIVSSIGVTAFQR